ncbi:MAG TPA: ATP-binding protein [Micromonosporaceae bacterium]|nr:ATP-binding protein [Micromonosporaceae bacterium]
MEERPGRGRRPRWSAETLFAGPGETRAALRAKDWAATPLGPVEWWPTELRAAIRTVLPSRIPMLLWWGPQLVQIFNDAYTPVLGDKYPAAVGQPGAECWAEVWDVLGPPADRVFAGQGATYSENERLFLRRHGYLEETYWTSSYSPVGGEDGSVAGIFVATTDVTARVLGDRRLDTLRELGTLSVAGTDTADDACRAAVGLLARRRTDFPVVLAYLRTDLMTEGSDLGLVATAGVAEGSELARDRASGVTGMPEVWRAAQSGRAELVSALADRYPGTFRVDGPLGPAPVNQALVLPLRVSGRTQPVGVLVVGASPYRELDTAYQGFLHLVADRVSTALAYALAYAEGRHRAAALAEIDKVKTQFFSDASHELRTPLTLIAGPVEESLSDTRDPLPPPQRERLEIVRRSTARLRRLVDNILDVVRIESGRMQPHPQPTDLAVLTRGIAESFEFALHRAGLGFVVDAPALPRTAYVDRDMWEKIVVNLLSNALKYTLTGEVRLTLRDEDGQAVLAVTDTGVGIPPDEQPLLFERFHRVRGSDARSHEGAGIGLTLVNELTGLHRGTVGVRSQPGAGSTFTVRLPYGEPFGEAPPSTAGSGAPVASQGYVEESARWLPEVAPPPAGPVHPGAATVLVVEDNADLRTFLTTLLAPHWHVEVATDGQAALERLDSVRPDLVLTDVMMPRMDGFELLTALRGDPRTALVPVVMLSGRAGEESAVDGLASGADDYLVKPFSSVELLARVRANLELARLRNHESAWRTAVTGSLQEAFCIVDDSGAVIEVNDAFRHLVGADAGHLPARPPYPWWPQAQAEPAERRQAEEALRQILASHGGRARFPIRHADGHRIWVEALFSSVRDPDTGRRTYAGTLRDITDELLAADRQAALARLATRLAKAGDVTEVLSAGLGRAPAAVRRARGRRGLLRRQRPGGCAPGAG